MHANKMQECDSAYEKEAALLLELVSPCPRATKIGMMEGIFKVSSTVQKEVDRC